MATPAVALESSAPRPQFPVHAAVEQAAPPLIVIDPGHGMGNKKPGVFDPGIVGVKNTREAELALEYAKCLQLKLLGQGTETLLTRLGNDDPCPLDLRVKLAKTHKADLLVSIHFNGDAVEGNSAPDNKVKGCEVLYRSAVGTPAAERSIYFARAVAEAMGENIRLRPKPVVDRQDLYVLRYSPSILIEVGFLDDPEDAELLLSRQWMNLAMGCVARAILAQF